MSTVLPTFAAPIDFNLPEIQTTFQAMSTHPEIQRIFLRAQQRLASAMENPKIQQQYTRVLASSSPTQREALQTAMNNPQTLLQNPSLMAILQTLNTVPGVDGFEAMLSQFFVNEPLRDLHHPQVALQNVANFEISPMLEGLSPEQQAEVREAMREVEQLMNSPEMQWQRQQIQQVMETSPNALLVRQNASPEQLNALEQMINNPLAFFTTPELGQFLRSILELPGGAELDRELRELAAITQPTVDHTLPPDDGSCCNCFFKWIKNNILDPIWNLFKCIFCCECKSSSITENENTQQAEQLAQRRQRELLE